MANWQRVLRLNPEWDSCGEDEITRQELAASIALKLSTLSPLQDEWAEEQRLELADSFRDMGRDSALSEGEFNGMMSDLYDWGDTPLDDKWNGKKVCWVDCMTSDSAPESRS